MKVEKWKGSKGKRSILVVEDDPTYRQLLNRVLKDLGVHSVISTEDSESAILTIESTPIDLLISDVLLPKVNGYKLAQLVRAHHPEAEILLTTGYQSDLSRFDFRGIRCHLLHKPYHKLSDVTLLIQRLLDKQDVFEGMDEDSFGENDVCPEITEWVL